MPSHSRNTWVCVFSVFTLFCAVKATPLEQYAVDLTTCELSTTEALLASECISICEPVRRAQETCEQGLSCTCSIASPTLVKDCLECQYTAYHESSVTSASRRALSAYAELCGSDPIGAESEDPSPSEDAPHLESRERIAGTSLECAYGVPVLSLRLPPAFAPMHADHRIFGFMLLCVAIVVCIIDHARRKPDP